MELLDLGWGLENLLLGTPREHKASRKIHGPRTGLGYGAGSIQAVQCLAQFLLQTWPMPSSTLPEDT